MDERENLLEYETLIHLSDESICELLQKGCCTIVLKAPDSEQIRDLYIGNYAVRYLIAEEIIYILRIWHNKENEKKFIT